MRQHMMTSQPSHAMVMADRLHSREWPGQSLRFSNWAQNQTIPETFVSRREPWSRHRYSDLVSGSVGVRFISS